jgi:hypothetical protein
MTRRHKDTNNKIKGRNLPFIKKNGILQTQEV